MALKCFNCDKGVMYGHKVSHAKNRTNRLFLPNLHYARIAIDGGRKRVRLCTKCLRVVKRDMIEKKSSPKSQTAMVATA